MLKRTKGSEVEYTAESARIICFPIESSSGSHATLTDWCSTEIGNVGAGLVVSQSRKEEFKGGRLLLTSGSAPPSAEGSIGRCARSETILSRVAIHDGTRSRFCSSTQSPLTEASLIILSASGPWPCPIETTLKAACFNKSPTGSAPAPTRSTIGVVADEASNAARSPFSFVVEYSGPNSGSCASKGLTAAQTLSNRSACSSRNLRNGLRGGEAHRGQHESWARRDGFAMAGSALDASISPPAAHWIGQQVERGVRLCVLEKWAVCSRVSAHV